MRPLFIFAARCQWAASRSSERCTLSLYLLSIVSGLRVGVVSGAEPFLYMCYPLSVGHSRSSKWCALSLYLLSIVSGLRVGVVSGAPFLYICCPLSVGCE